MSIIAADQAMSLIESGVASVSGFCRGDNEQRFAILTRHDTCETCHVECGNEHNETPAQMAIEAMGGLS